MHGLSQLLLVHTRKRESKERLDLGKKFPEPNLPSTQKGHDYGRATFARVSFFKRIQLLDVYADHLELFTQTTEISMSVCMTGRLLAQWTFSEFQILPRKIPFSRPCSSVHIRSTSVNTQAWVDNFVHLFRHPKSWYGALDHRNIGIFLLGKLLILDVSGQNDKLY